MLRNYFVTALNNLLKDKVFSLINVAGLAIGLAACLLIALYVRNENTYDEHWSNGDRLYRITTSRTGEITNTNARNPFPLVTALQQYFPDAIEAAVRLMPYTRELTVGGNQFQQRIVEVDTADIMKMFDFETIDGNMNGALDSPETIALGEELALKLFGRVDVAGATLTMRVSEKTVRDLRVAAVYRLRRGNTTLELPAMVAMDVASKINRWNVTLVYDYVLLKAGVDASSVNAHMHDFVDHSVDIADFPAGSGALPSSKISFGLQKISDVYLGSSFESRGRGNKVMVIAFAAIALLVLAIGCMNFIILSMAKSVYRAREVAIRKAVGANRWQLVVQYLGESILLVVPAMVLALVLVELCLPPFEGVLGTHLDTTFPVAGFLSGILALLVAVALAGGFYPAFVLSHFPPAGTLRSGRVAQTRGATRLRDVLVTFQFAVTIALITATLVIYAQVQYTVNRNPGFDDNNLVFIDGVFRRDASEQNLLKQRVAMLTGVTAVSLSGYRPMRSTGNSERGMTFSLDRGGDSGNVFIVNVDHDFFRTYRIPIVAGRDFAEGRDQASPIFEEGFRGSASCSSVILNESAVSKLGFANPGDAIGRVISSRGSNSALHGFTIVGIARDAQIYGLRNEPRPEAYVISLAQGALIDSLAVRYAGNPQQILSRLDATWHAVTGDTPLTAVFMEQIKASEFARERMEATMLVGFSALAITIACLGLFGSATFNVERRGKEIAVRKVMGGAVAEIVGLLLWQFSRPVLLANAVAWPLALWAMMNWLERFPYRIAPLTLVPICFVAGFLALSIAWVTVGGTAAKAASQKPVLALRYE